MPATPYWAVLAAVIRGPLTADAEHTRARSTSEGGRVTELVTSTGPAAAAAVYAADAVKRVLPDRIATQVQHDVTRAIEGLQRPVEDRRSDGERATGPHVRHAA